MSDESELDEMFQRLRGGDESVREELFERIYSALHRLARASMSSQRPSHTLQPTALVNEAWLKLSRAQDVRSRADFLGLASVAMRQILVDHARGKGRAKREGNHVPVELEQLAQEYEERATGLIALDDALEHLAAHDADLARLVELRFFGGCSAEDTAAVLGLSVRQASRWWNVAKAYLRQQLDGE